MTRARIATLNATVIRWRADPNAYVDVFFGDMDGGLEYAPLVRYEWPLGIYGTSIVREAPFIDIGTLDPRVPFETPDAAVVRFYDRGACSGAMAWRDLGQALSDRLDVAIDDAIKSQGNDLGCGAHPDPETPWVVTPILRAEDPSGSNRDAFRFTRTYRIEICGGNDTQALSLGFVARFVAGEGVLALALEDTFAEGPGAEEVQIQLGTMVAPLVTQEIPRIIGQEVRVPGTTIPALPCRLDEPDECGDQLRDLIDGFPTLGVAAEDILDRNAVCAPSTTTAGGACALVPNFLRSHQRPEGLEVILSDWDANEEYLGLGDADPLFPLLQQGGACEREELYVPAQFGYLGQVREFPDLSLPLPFGDEL